MRLWLHAVAGEVIELGAATASTDQGPRVKRSATCSMRTSALSPTSARQMSEHEISELEAVAFHEAGHAVVAISLSAPVYCVKIDTNGEGEMHWGDAQLELKQLEVFCQVKLAGRHAEALYTGEIREIAATDDWKQIRRAVDRWAATPDRAQTYIDTLDQRAAGIVAALAPAISKVASRLCVDRELTGSQIEALIGSRATSNP